MAVLHQEIIHDLNTDCVEFCPSQEHPDWLILGSYQLCDNGDRHGGLDLFSLQHSVSGQDSSDDDGRPQLKRAATARGLPGVFDARWQKLQDRWIVTVALSDGTLRLFRVPVDLAAGGDAVSVGAQSGADTDGEGGGDGKQDPGAPGANALQLEEVSSCRAASQMALSVDWAGTGCGEQGARQHIAAVSSSGGGVTLLQAAEAGLKRLMEWHTHELEVWTAVFDKHQPHVLYSGADDCTFKGWDCRVAAPVIDWGPISDNEGYDPFREDPTMFGDSRTHAAGVCCIVSHPQQQHVVATGSYDERIRVWDARNPSKPLVSAQVPTGGGTWRLRWHPQDPSLLLAACMYNGFAVARVGDAWDSVEVVESYKGHESIAYGADWHPTAALAAAREPGEAGAAAAEGGGGGERSEGAKEEEEEGAAAAAAAAAGGLGASVGAGSNLVATCSFYDRRVHLWTPETRVAEAR